MLSNDDMMLRAQQSRLICFIAFPSPPRLYPPNPHLFHELDTRFSAGYLRPSVFSRAFYSVFFFLPCRAAFWRCSSSHPCPFGAPSFPRLHIHIYSAVLRDGSHTHGVVFFILGRCDYGNDRVMYIVFRSAGVFWANGCIESGRGRGAKLVFLLFLSFFCEVTVTVLFCRVG